MAVTNNESLRFLWRAGTQAVDTSNGNISANDIVFLPDKHQIWAGGIYFGLTDDQLTALNNSINQVSTDLDAVEERVAITTQLSKTLVDIANELKAKVDGGAYSPSPGSQGSTIAVTTAGENPQAITNLTDAVNRVWELAQSASQAAGVKSVSNYTGDASIEITSTGGDGTGAITIKTDAGKIGIVSAISKQGNNGISAQAGTSVESVLNSINNQLIADETALANLGTQAQAIGAQAIKISSGTQGVQTGISPSSFTNADSIVSALESVFNQLQGTSTNWATGASAEAKTLGTLRDLIAGLRTDLNTLSNSVGTLSDTDFASITEAINKIKAELDDPNNGTLATFLDKVQIITGGSVASGTQAGKYVTKSGTGGADEYAANIGEIITNLEKEIAAAKAAAEASGVTSLNSKTGALTITGSQGVVVDNNAGTEIKLKATSDATLTAALTTVENGATAASGATVQTALNNINAVAAQGVTDAATAQAKANTADTNANNALNQLKWVVVS